MTGLCIRGTRPSSKCRPLWTVFLQSRSRRCYVTLTLLKAKHSTHKHMGGCVGAHVHPTHTHTHTHTHTITTDTVPLCVALRSGPSVGPLRHAACGQLTTASREPSPTQGAHSGVTNVCECQWSRSAACLLQLKVTTSLKV